MNQIINHSMIGSCLASDSNFLQNFVFLRNFPADSTENKNKNSNIQFVLKSITHEDRAVDPVIDSLLHEPQLGAETEKEQRG